jgi:hypothetical protein
MKPALRVLVPLLALAACRASSQVVETGKSSAPRGASYAWRVAVEDVPADASEVIVATPLPASTAAYQVSGLRACVLVGNALAEISPVGKEPDSPGSHPAWSWSVQREGEEDRLVVASDGPAIELALHFEVLGNADASALETELVRGTSARVNGQPWSLLTTRAVVNGATGGGPVR